VAREWSSERKEDSEVEEGEGGLWRRVMKRLPLIQKVDVWSRREVLPSGLCVADITSVSEAS